mgnify:CR=1 FL=1
MHPRLPIFARSHDTQHAHDLVAAGATQVVPETLEAALLLLFGLLGDVIGLTTALAVVASVALTTVPMVWALRPAFRSD